MRKVSGGRGVDNGTKSRYGLRCIFRIPLERLTSLFSAGFVLIAEIFKGCFFSCIPKGVINDI